MGKIGFLLAPFLLFYIVFVFVPLAGVLVKSFSTSRSLTFELLDWDALRSVQWTLANYQRLATTGYYVRAAINTILIAAVAAGGALLVGTPIAYTLAHPLSRTRSWLDYLVTLPIYLPGILASYALFIFFGSAGPVNYLGELLLGRPIRLVFTLPGILLGTLYIVVPMYIQTARSGFKLIRRDIPEASYSLGAREFYTFRRILFPMALPSILAASIVSFTYTMSLVVVVLVLGGGGRTLTILPLEVIAAAQSVDFDLPMAAAISVVLLIVSLAGQLFVRRLLGAAAGGGFLG